MKCRNALSAVLRSLRKAFNSRAFVHSAPTPAAYGPVAPTETPQKQGGARTLLSRRAERLAVIARLRCIYSDDFISATYGDPN